MDKYETVGTSKTPAINFDLTKGTLAISGCSIPEHAIELYKPLFEAINIYASSPKPTTQVTIQLEYFNTSSSKCILDVFKKLEKIRNDGSVVTVTWNYEKEDESMLETGKEYQEMINIPFNLVEIEG